MQYGKSQQRVIKIYKIITIMIITIYGTAGPRYINIYIYINNRVSSYSF